MYDANAGSGDLRGNREFRGRYGEAIAESADGATALGDCDGEKLSMEEVIRGEYGSEMDSDTGSSGQRSWRIGRWVRRSQSPLAISAARTTENRQSKGEEGRSGRWVSKLSQHGWSRQNEGRDVVFVD